MKSIASILSGCKAGPVIDPVIGAEQYTPLDLSIHNKALNDVDLGDPDACLAYIESILDQNRAQVAFGGYLEQRNLYSGNSNFSLEEERRDVHLGVDYWTKAGTKVMVPLDGVVHSFKNNAVKGDYGPTIILKHRVGEQVFYSLYGHLSLRSLEGLHVGKAFAKGEELATVGKTEENVHYAPHLHFQLILDLQEMQGDYPGVCKASELKFYRENCPDPGVLFLL